MPCLSSRRKVNLTAALVPFSCALPPRQPRQSCSKPSGKRMLLPSSMETPAKRCSSGMATPRAVIRHWTAREPHLVEPLGRWQRPMLLKALLADGDPQASGKAR